MVNAPAKANTVVVEKRMFGMYKVIKQVQVDVV